MTGLVHLHNSRRTPAQRKAHSHRRRAKRDDGKGNGMTGTGVKNTQFRWHTNLERVECSHLYGVYMSSSFITPLRYPGGKGRLAAWLTELIKHNGLEEGTYIEPYAGGAGAAMSLLLKGHVRNIVINDADPVIYAFWWSILNDTKSFISKIYNTEVSMENWHRQREIVKKADTKHLTELGFATFFLNRTNRSGIIKGGVIGGQAQKGKYKIDARYNKEKLAQRINKIAIFKDYIDLYNMDAMDLILCDEIEKNENTLVYFDPPYYKKGAQLYANHYKPEDHKKIAEIVKNIKTPWLVTYDNCEEIKELYKDEKRAEFSLHYSTHMNRPEGQELLFYKNLHIKSLPTLKR